MAALEGPAMPGGYKKKLRIDPLRALEPAKKKLSVIESQRVMAVLEDYITNVEGCTLVPLVLLQLDRFSVQLGQDLLQQLQQHRAIQESYRDLRQQYERALQRERKERKAASAAGSEAGSRPGSAESRADSVASISSQAEAARRSLILVAQQLNFSTKSLIRDLVKKPDLLKKLKKEEDERPEEAANLIQCMEELKGIVFERLLTTPLEEQERGQYLVQVSERERHHAKLIDKLEAELNHAIDEKDADVKKKNDLIRKLQADIHQIERYSEESHRRIKQEAEKQEAADTKNSEGKVQKLQQEVNQLRTQLQNTIAENREEESKLRIDKFKKESAVETWVQRYDNDMGERQSEFEEIDSVYTDEKKQLYELEERFKTLEKEYTTIMEERRVERERRELAERELQLAIKAATTIQAFWRSFKVRKALKGKKKKGGKKSKK